MAAGRPTVLVIDGVIRDVVEKAAGGIFVLPGRPGALADAVMRLAREPETRRRTGASARSFVEARFSRDDQAELFVKCLEDAAPGRA